MADLDEYPILCEFKYFIGLIRSFQLSNAFIDQKCDELKKNFIEFFTILSDSQIKATLNNELDEFFDRIKIFIDSMQKEVQYISNIKKNSQGRKQIIFRFRNDLVEFISILSNFIIFQSKILRKIKRMIDKKIDQNKIQRVLKQFYLEISLFNFSYNIKTFNKPPYYQITSIPCYKHIHNDFYSATKKFFNVIGPNGSGKTKLIPLFLASRSLGYTISSQFIILIENDVESIPEIEKTLNMIISNDEFYEKDENPLIITSSVQTFIEQSKDEVKYPVIIAILTPIDALQLIHKEYKITPRNVTFLKKTTFIIDDVNDRKVETDVLSQDILDNIFNLDLLSEIGKLVLIGTFSDSRFLNIFGRHCETFNIQVETSQIEIRPIKCGNYFEIGKISILKEMKIFLDTWTQKNEIDVGSIIAFLPNVKTGRSILKYLGRIYQENSPKIILLKTKIAKKESLQSLYKRLLDEIERKTAEKSLSKNDISKNIVFIYPLDLTGYISEEEKNFVNSSLPLPFIEKNFVRLILATNKNEHLLKVPDTTVLFDSGLTETEYYDSKKTVSSFILEELPLSRVCQRNILFNNQKKCVHFTFEVGISSGKKKMLPSVRRCNLDQSILLLRKIGIKFEKQKNLPNEPLTVNVESAMAKLKKNGFIDKKGDLTELGIQTSKFSSVSPNLALATTKYAKNHEFAFLVSLIIEQSPDLIDNSQTPLLCDHFCKESDVVTILESIFALNTNVDKNAIDNSGFSINALESIYIIMASTFEKKSKEEGKKLVTNSINWARKQKGGTLKMIDDFVDLLDQDNYIEIRKATFSYVSGVGAGSDPTLVYNANKILSFEGETEALIKFSKRPGWNGLQAPGDIIVLSFQIEEAVQINRGFLLHHNQKIADKNIGIISQNVESFLNSCFFVALFEAYWDIDNIENKLIPIYHSYKPKKETGFLIHINENNKKTYINYCPKNLQVQNEMDKAIKFLSSLMPFVPRSIIAKSDVPLCGIELLGYGAGAHYDTYVFQIDNPDPLKPLAYRIDRDSLNYARNNIKELRKKHPKIRFSITGESIYYKFIKEKQIETDFSYPNTDPSIKSVFDPLKSSHLVLLVDSNYHNKPDGIHPIPWISKAKKSDIKEKYEDEFNLMIDTSAKILNGLGSVKRVNDLFFITLNGGFPTVSSGRIPDELQNQVGLKDCAIQGGIHELIRQFEKNYLKIDDLYKQIPLEVLGSTNHCKKYKTNELQQTIIDQINNKIMIAFKYKDLTVDTIFIGNSMICISISNLPQEITSHPSPNNMYDNTYKPCKADEIINTILNKLSVPVSTITHEPTIRITAQHFLRFRISQKEFVEYVNRISSKFGFLVSNEIEYTNISDGGVLGEIDIELIGQNSCIACASMISKKFGELDSTVSITNTMTMDAMSTMNTLHCLDPTLGKIPKIGPLKHIIRVPQCEVESMKDLVKAHNNWKFNEEYRVLIFPHNDNEEAQRILRRVREENNIACFFSCGMDEPELLPQCIYVTEKDGSVKTFGICKDCAIALIQNFETIQEIYNPVTHLIDQDHLKDIKTQVPGLTLIDEDKDSKGNLWPQVPIGQVIWALMSDRSGILTSYVKAWFTILIEFAIQTCGLFIYCPIHRKYPILCPGENETVKCPVCDMIFCKDCDSWHQMDAECFKGLPGVKRCPKCHCPGEKFTGCNHIHCPRCHTDWDYATEKRMNETGDYDYSDDADF